MDLLERVSYRLKLRDFRLLEAVVRWQSMAKAAERLNMSQPAVSKAISELEHTLGVRLFDRGRQGVEPTIYGLALLKMGVAMMDDLRQGMSQIESLADPGAGAIRIAASEPMATGILPLIIGNIVRRYPRVSILIVPTTIGALSHNRRQYLELFDRQVDLVFGPVLAASDRESLRIEDLFSDPIVPTVGAAHASSRRRSLRLSDLINEPWCLPRLDSNVGARCREAFMKTCGALPRQIVEYESAQAQIGLVVTSDFCTMLPGSLLHFSARRLGIKPLPIELPVAKTPIGIVTLKNRTLNPVTDVFIKTAREIAGPLLKGAERKRARGA